MSVFHPIAGTQRDSPADAWFYFCYRLSGNKLTLILIGRIQMKQLCIKLSLLGHFNSPGTL